MNETLEHNIRLLEAILFAAAEPLAEKALARRLPGGTDVAALLDQLKRQYADRGVRLVRAGGSWAFRTADDLRPLLEREIEVARKLGRATIETLAIIAYHQPVTRSEIEEIRGVGLSKGTLDILFEQGWVQPRGRRKTPGRPVIWGTTDAFLDHFGLASADDLPGMDELKAAGLLDTRPAVDTYRINGELPAAESEDGVLPQAPHLQDPDEDAEDQPLDPNGE